MKRDELGSCLTEEQNRIMRNMDSDVEKIEYMEKHDPVLFITEWLLECFSLNYKAR